MDKNDHPIAQLPAADFTIVKYWDQNWTDCMAVHHSAAKALQKIVAEHKDWTANIIYVDATVKRQRKLQD